MEVLRRGGAVLGEGYFKFDPGRLCGAHWKKPAHETGRGQHGDCEQPGELRADSCGRLFHLCGNFGVKVLL